MSDEGGKAYQQLSPRDAKRLVQRFEAALRSHARDFEKGRDKENALGAFEGALGAFLELRDAKPELKADIDVVLARNGYPVLEH